MANLIEKWTSFYDSPLGRKLVNWGVTAVGVLLTSGTIPLDTPLVLGLSLGQIITILGLRLPSHGVQGPVEVAPSIKGT